MVHLAEHAAVIDIGGCGLHSGKDQKVLAAVLLMVVRVQVVVGDGDEIIAPFPVAAHYLLRWALAVGIGGVGVQVSFVPHNVSPSCVLAGVAMKFFRSQAVLVLPMSAAKRLLFAGSMV